MQNKAPDSLDAGHELFSGFEPIEKDGGYKDAFRTEWGFRAGYKDTNTSQQHGYGTYAKEEDASKIAQYFRAHPEFWNLTEFKRVYTKDKYPDLFPRAPVPAPSLLPAVVAPATAGRKHKLAANVNQTRKRNLARLKEDYEEGLMSEETYHETVAKMYK